MKFYEDLLNQAAKIFYRLKRVKKNVKKVLKHIFCTCDNTTYRVLNKQ